MGRRLAVLVLIVIAAAWAVSVVSAPVVRSAAGTSMAARGAALTYLVGALLCHQRPDRSFHVAGVQLPVCARCAALYWGGAAGLLAWLLVRARPDGARRSNPNVNAHVGHHFSGAEGAEGAQATGAGSAAGAQARDAEGALARARFKRALLLSGAPVAISVATAASGIWDPSNVVRALISAPLGLVLGALLAAVTLEDLR